MNFMHIGIYVQHGFLSGMGKYLNLNPHTAIDVKNTESDMQWPWR